MYFYLLTFFRIFQPKEIITCYARSSDEHRTSLWTDLFIPIYLNHSKVNKQIFEEVQFAIYRILVKDLTTKYRKNSKFILFFPFLEKLAYKFVFYNITISRIPEFGHQGNSKQPRRVAQVNRWHNRLFLPKSPFDLHSRQCRNGKVHFW